MSSDKLGAHAGVEAVYLVSPIRKRAIELAQDFHRTRKDSSQSKPKLGMRGGLYYGVLVAVMAR